MESRLRKTYIIVMGESGEFGKISDCAFGYRSGFIVGGGHWPFGALVASSAHITHPNFSRGN